jgi:hypothetical protein
VIGWRAGLQDCTEPGNVPARPFGRPGKRSARSSAIVTAVLARRLLAARLDRPANTLASGTGEPVDNASWAGNRMRRGTLAHLGIPGKSRIVSQRESDAKVALERLDRMSADAFFKKVRTYADLSEEAERAWAPLLRRRQYRKDESFIVAGDIPTTFA